MPKDPPPPPPWASTRALISADFARMAPLMDGPSLPKKLFWFFLPQFQGLLHYRIARHLHLHGWRNLANLLYLFSLYATRIDIPPRTVIGAGCLLGHVPIVLCGRIGERFTCRGDGGVGGGFDARDIGGGPGLPVIGDDVTLAIKALVLGPVRIGQGVRVGPGATVMRNVGAGAVVAAPLSRVSGGADETPDPEHTDLPPPTPTSTPAQTSPAPAAPGLLLLADLTEAP